MTAEQAVGGRSSICSKRRSVVHEHELWRHALETHARSSVSLPEIKAATRKREYIRGEQFQEKITTREVLQRELNIVKLAQYQIAQIRTVRGQLSTVKPFVWMMTAQGGRNISCPPRDFVTLFRGGAGTGKSFTLREIKVGLNRAGHVVQVLAPQAPTGHRSGNVTAFPAHKPSVLCSKQNFLTRGAVVIVDEAGQIGGQQMLELLSLVQTVKGRVILSGDTHQHEAVEASDALRAIENQYSGLGYAGTDEHPPSKSRLGKKHGLNVNGWNNIGSP